MDDKSTKRIITIFFTAIILLMLCVCGLFLYQSNQKNEQHTAFTITLEKDSINFHGAIGDVVSCKDIQSIHYYEQKLPAGKKQGDAKFDEIGKCRAYLYTDNSSYIKAQTKDNVYLFNLANQKDTYTLYDKIKNLTE